MFPKTGISNTSAENRWGSISSKMLSSRFSERHYFKGIACTATEGDLNVLLWPLHT